MANQEHLAILKQGVEVWNQWREGNPDVWPNLIGAALSGANLSGANLFRANLDEADLRGANLTRADLREVDLRRARLQEAQLIGADLSRTDLSGARLGRADLTESGLFGTQFDETELSLANFQHIHTHHTIFSNVDLSRIKELETVYHHGPSYIDIHTLYRSRGKIPGAFLRGAGLDDHFLSHIPSFFGGPMIRHYSCFISYSSKDQEFAERLHADLQAKNVRCWFAPEDLKIGDSIRDAIDQSIRLHEKLLVILSRNSVESKWVEDEVETALEKEESPGRLALFPVRIDESVRETGKAWAKKLLRRHIGDFTNWKDHDAYQKAFKKLLKDLKSDGQPPESQTGPSE